MSKFIISQAQTSLQATEAAIQKELRASGISPEVIDLNIAIIPDIEIDHVTREVVSTPLYDAMGWHYTRWGKQTASDKMAIIFQQESGETWQAKIFGQTTDGGRSGNYRAPQGIGDKAYLPSIPKHTVDAIAAQVGVEPPNLKTESFWNWLLVLPKEIKQQIPLIVTEGGKKALSAISQGIPAISLYGCKCFPHELKERLKDFRVFIALDQGDTKKTAKEAVNQGIKRLGKGLSGIAHEVRILEWTVSYGKGLDDLIVSQGAEKFKELLEKAPTFQSWQNKSIRKLPKVDLKIHSRFIPPDLNIPDSKKVVCLKSGKGTGKTQHLKQVIDPLLNKGEKVIVLSHRVQLGKELGERLGVEYRTELTAIGKVQGYVLCVESSHDEANPPFNPKHWDGANIIIDECEQVLWHVLNSPTCSKYRQKILESLKDLLQRAIEAGGKIYLSDADFSRLSFNLIKGLTGLEDSDFYVIENTYNAATNREATFTNSPETLVAQIIESLESGERIIIHTSSQQASSTWGTINLETKIKRCFPNLKILRIDSESSSQPGHPAYGSVSNLNDVLPLYDVVIASPVIETGVSIETPFDRVFGLFAGGVQSVDSVCQSLSRVRSNIPRVVYAPEYSQSRIGNGSSDPFAIESAEHDKTNRLIDQLSTADLKLEGQDLPPIYLKTWASFAAIHNIGFKNYATAIKSKLESEGYVIRDYVPENLEKAPEVKAAMQAIKKENYEAYCEAVCEVENPDNSELEHLQSKRAKTELERLQQRRGELSRRYLMEKITPEIVKKDDKGWFLQILLHYYITVGKQHLKERDHNRLLKMLKNGTGKLFIPDVNKSTLSVKILALEAINIPEFLQSEKEFSSDSLAEWFAKLKNPIARSQLKDILGVPIREKDTPIALANRLLGTMGLSLSLNRKEKLATGKRLRIYRGATIPDDGRLEIFTRWLERDSKMYQHDTVGDSTSVIDIYPIQKVLSPTTQELGGEESEPKVLFPTPDPEIEAPALPKTGKSLEPGTDRLVVVDWSCRRVPLRYSGLSLDGGKTIQTGQRVVITGTRYLDSDWQVFIEPEGANWDVGVLVSVKDLSEIMEDASTPLASTPPYIDIDQRDGRTLSLEGSNQQELPEATPEVVSPILDIMDEPWNTDPLGVSQIIVSEVPSPENPDIQPAFTSRVANIIQDCYLKKTRLEYCGKPTDKIPVGLGGKKGNLNPWDAVIITDTNFYRSKQVYVKTAGSNWEWGIPVDWDDLAPYRDREP